MEGITVDFGASCAIGSRLWCDVITGYLPTVAREKHDGRLHVGGSGHIALHNRPG